MYSKFTICFLLFIIITGSLSSDWEEFKRDYNKQYASTKEEAERKEIFLKNVNQIKEYERTHPDATFTMKINDLTDRRTEELISGSESFLNIRSKATEEPIQSRTIIPTSLDWRYRNVTTPVYNQSQLHPASAIVAVEVIESYRAITGKNLIRGDIDQVYDCCGNTSEIFDCILNKLGGDICSERTRNASHVICGPNVCEPLVIFNEAKQLEEGKENIMLEWIQDSPLYVTIDASQITFRQYEGGIYSDMKCLKNNPNHVVQLVGYGFRSGIPYWLCKNSWGEQWGEEGYIRIERGRNMCGIAKYVVQIGMKPTVNNSVRLLNFDIVYLAFFCFFVNIFAN